jgi:hypothetical protein
MINFELTNDRQEGDTRALNAFASNLWTSIPGIIQSFNAAQQTVVVQPSIMMKQFDINGVAKDVALPLLLDCPVQFPSSGGYTLTFPVAKGDECLVVFSARCIDAWWQSGGVQVQAVMRMHDLSDGFAVLGFSSTPRVISGISTNSTQLRSNDGAAYVELASGHIANIVAPGGINFTGPANFTGTVTMNGHRVDETHTHTGVQPGGGITGVVS